MLRLTAESISRPGKPHGCMVVLGATNCAIASRGAQDYILAIRQRAPEVVEDRLARAVAEGDLAPGVRYRRHRGLLRDGHPRLGIRAGDGATRAALMAAVDGAMAAWDQLTGTSRKARRPRRSD